jgi:hypothetical protein
MSKSTKQKQTDALNLQARPPVNAPDFPEHTGNPFQNHPPSHRHPLSSPSAAPVKGLLKGVNRSRKGKMRKTFTNRTVPAKSNILQ